MENSLATTEGGTLATVESGVNESAALLRHAIDKGMDPDGIAKLVELRNQMEDRESAKLFAMKMAEFQSNVPQISKTSTAKIATRGGSGYAYKYAELPEIIRTIQPTLNACGLSFTWDSETVGGQMTCICHVRHVNGHSAATRFSCPTDSASAMNNQQKAGAALTYAKRQSLVAAFGLTTCDPDDDGVAPPVPITAKQVDNLNWLIDKVNTATGASGDDMLPNKAFFDWAGVSALAEITTDNFDSVTLALGAKLRAAEGANNENP